MGRHVYWSCPYFQYDRPLIVFCEGGYRVEFPNEEKIKKYIKRHCCDPKNYIKCAVAAQIESEYEEMLARKEQRNGK